METLGFEMNKRSYEKWNICKNEKTCKALENAWTIFGLFEIIHEIKTNTSSVIHACYCIFKNIYIFYLINN